ncbi:hypothetical protein [Halobacterium salinarum]|uniref:hypothetical protein n=1 Tax=Halobacterium salinarum TaxID=2242 RepID=UPI0025565DDE|nr:hypothetical protein [Halobacterium salinarum]MDL0121714.1 hypothetical protein [Halobacterium salinarum]
MSQQTLPVDVVKTLFDEHEQRPELWIPTSDDGFTRTGVIHATPPTDPDYAHKLTDEGSAVAETTTRLAKDFEAPIEVQTYPRPVPRSRPDIEAVTCHVFHIAPHFVDGRALQSKVRDFDGKVVNSGLDAAHKIVEEAFPDVYEVEVGEFDLNPISAGGSVSTCRLVNEDSKEVSGVGKVTTDSMADVFDALTHAREPFVHQLIVEPGDGKFYITSRLAPLSPDYTFEGKRGVARLLKEGANADLARAFNNVGVTSNFNIDIDDYLDIEYNHQINGRTTHTVTYKDGMRKRYDTKLQHRKKVDALIDAVLGHTEFSRLLRGSTGWKSTLKDYEYYGRFWIPPATIGYFTETYAHYYDHDPWQHTVRGAPVFTPREIGDIDIRTDWETPNLEIDVEGRHQTDGTDEHLKLGQDFITFGRARGDDITRVEQDGTTQPDQLLTTDNGYINLLEKKVESDIVHVEPEWENSSKPANILTNVERAVAADRHVILVFKSEAAADRAYTALRTTFRELTDHGARTFQGDVFPEIDGEMLVTPESESTWYLTDDDMLVHVIDGEVVTCCPAEADLTTVEHGCATARYEDGKYIVTTRDGETLIYENEAAFKRDWTRVTMPHVPIDISYLQYVTIMYKTDTASEDTGDFVEYEATPAWERANGKQNRYSEFGAEIAEDFLVEAPGAELNVKACHTAMMGLYQWCTNKSAPDKEWFSRGLPDHIKRKDTTDGKKALSDHTWVFSRGLVSPHLPSVDAEIDLTL